MKKRLLLVLIPLLLLALAGLAALFYLSHDLPDPATISQRLYTPSLRFTDRNGRLLYESLPADGGRHTVLDLAQIPLTLRQATIATEDSSFYQNPGVDLGGILRAAWINLQGGETLAGGSTITQQVARGLLLSPDERAGRSLERKLREAILAWNLARTLSKDQILALYLNQMYYGNLAYGVEAASQTYFQRPAAELDLAQAALLAGLPQAPAAYDPYQHPEAAKQRQRTVLGLMQKAGFLTDSQRALAEAELLVYSQVSYPMLAPHFVMMVRQQANALITPQELYAAGGLTVRTSLDLDAQAQAEQAVRHQLQRLQQAGQQSQSYNVNDAALVALDPASGEILAMVGSPDYANAAISGQVNMATAPRQPGSALKPLIYAAAFDPSLPAPWTPATMLLDVSTNFTTHDGKSYTPANYDSLEHGPVLARPALASSLNIPAVLTLQHVGLPRLFTEAGTLGITTLGDPDLSDLSLALGGGDVSLLQLSAAYAALDSGGARVTPQSILDIRDPQGNIVYAPARPERPQVIDRRVAWLISDILSDDSARQLGFGLNSVLQIGRPAAVKTGTTTNFHDNWTVGYTPDLVVGVWAGNADQTPMRGINGLTGAAPIWAEFMRSMLNGRPERAFTRPPGLVQVEICALSGMLPAPDCPYRRLEWFIDGTQPRQADTLCHQVKLDLATGLPAGPDAPPERVVTRLALDLPPAALPWARSQGVLVYSSLQSAESADSGQVLALNSPALQILSPGNRSIFHLAPGLATSDQRLPVQIAVAEGLKQVMLWIDDQAVQAFSASPYAYWWQLVPGTHTLRATALNAQGESISSATVSIDVK